MKKPVSQLDIKIAKEGVQAFADALGIMPSMVKVTKDGNLRLKGLEEKPILRSKER